MKALSSEPIPTSLERVVAEFREAVRDAKCAVDYLDELDRRLVLFGWPSTSQWWAGTLRRFYRSSGAQLVLRVGRRGGKSTTLCRIAVLEALMGDHHVAPGDTATVAIVSVNKDEARERLNTIEGILRVLGVKNKALADRIDLADRDLAFRVFAATVGGVSGFSGICIICDEVSKWLDKDARANPATEVLSSVRPTMAGLPNARIFLSSSPMTPFDAHAKAFDIGDTEFQQVAFAETWVARPALTKAATQRLESDPRRWEREYAAVPMEGDEDSFFSPASLSACTRTDPRWLVREPGVEYVATMAPMLAHGAWSLVIARRGSVVDVAEVRGDIDVAETLAEIKARLAQFGLDYVLSHPEGAAHVREASRIGLHVRVSEMPIAQLANEMLAAVLRGAAELPPVAEVRADLLALRMGETAEGFSIRLADVERYPSYAFPVMLAIYEAGRLPAPKVASKKTDEERMLGDLVKRNRVEYAGAEE